jgi:teichuronic acid exporter
MFSAGLLATVVSRLDVFLIGRFFPAATLGFYTRAQSIDSSVKLFTAGSLSSVFFPAAARLQDDRGKLGDIYFRYLHFISFLSVALSGLLYLITPDLFSVLFTKKWDIAAVYFQLMCIAGVVWPMSSLMVTLISAVGNSKAYLNLELLRVIIQIPVYIFGLMDGITTFLWLFVAVRLVSLVLNVFFVSKEVRQGVMEQLGIILKYLIPGIIAVLLTLWIADFTSLNSLWIRLVIVSALFLILYLGGQVIVKTYALKELIFTLRKYVRAKFRVTAENQ